MVCGVVDLTGSIYYRRRSFRGIWGHFGGQPRSGFQVTIAVFTVFFGNNHNRPICLSKPALSTTQPPLRIVPNTHTGDLTPTPAHEPLGFFGVSQPV